MFDASTAEEFDGRLSALGEMLKGFDVPGDRKRGTLKRLSKLLHGELPGEAHSRVHHAIAILQSVIHLRNGGQHVGAAGDAAAALPSLGLTFPITDHFMA